MTDANERTDDVTIGADEDLVAAIRAASRRAAAEATTSDTDEVVEEEPVAEVEDSALTVSVDRATMAAALEHLRASRRAAKPAETNATPTPEPPSEVEDNMAAAADHIPPPQPPPGFALASPGESDRERVGPSLSSTGDEPDPPARSGTKIIMIAIAALVIIVTFVVVGLLTGSSDESTSGLVSTAVQVEAGATQ